MGWVSYVEIEMGYVVFKTGCKVYCIYYISLNTQSFSPPLKYSMFHLSPPSTKSTANIISSTRQRVSIKQKLYDGIIKQKFEVIS